jgi:DNA-directed RNA polymerase subunit alpha
MYLDVWTDGTITPVEAVSRSAELLIQQLTPFASLAQTAKIQVENKASAIVIPDEKYNMPVEELDLSVRTMNSLRRGGISTVGELVTKGEKELLSLRNFGQKSRQEVEERLKTLGLSLAIDSTKIKDEEDISESDFETDEEEEITDDTQS